MLPRFLASAIDDAARSAILDADEAHHLAHVMRLAVGDEIAVFDGRGREFRARVDRVGRGGATVTLLDAIRPAPEPAVAITLALALLKGDKLDGVVRDAVMMGAAAVQPLVSEHTIAGKGRADAAHRLGDRWRKIAIASAKQCRRAVVPSIGAPAAFDDYVAAERSEARLLLVEPVADVPAAALPALVGAPPSSAALLIGPEGGWSRGEVDRAVHAGWTPIVLGRRTLRADAMAVVAIGVLQYVWGDL